MTCQFGGVVAVNAVSFAVGAGRAVRAHRSQRGRQDHAVQPHHRPDGADARAASRYQGEDITGLPPHRVAERGIARTFQNVRLFGELSALDNVMIARHVRTRSGLVSGVLGLGSGPPGGARDARARGARCSPWSASPTGPRSSARNFSYGDQRRLEIARALALEPELLLLDEPAAGMNTGEKRALSDLIRSVRARLGLTILLIEHHVPLVMDLCDRIAVLNFGELIALGAAGGRAEAPRGDRGLPGRRARERRGARRAPARGRGPLDPLRPRAGPRAREPRGARGRGGDADRRQRRGQEHDAPLDLAHRPHPPRAHRLRRARHQRRAPERRGPDGHRPGARGPPHARPPERARQPPARRLHALGHRRDPGRRRAPVRALPAPGRAAPPDRRHAERRRAADAGHRPRPDEPAPPAAARRAVARAGAR